MRLKYSSTIIDAKDRDNPIADVCWSLNCKKMAVATSDRSVLLFDENLSKRDKFNTKPADQTTGKKSYNIIAIAFSDNSESLAVAQSDMIVFVYRLGIDWSKKKVICNKFPLSSMPTAIIATQNAFVVGTLEGKIRILDCKSNKSSSLWTAASCCVALTSNITNTNNDEIKIISGHADGSIYINGRIFFKYLYPPTGLVISSHNILVGGCDGKISVYDLSRGSLVKSIERPDTVTSDIKDIIKATMNPSGQTAVFATWNGFILVELNEGSSVECSVVSIPNFYATRAASWSPDGTKLVVGSQHGAVLLYEAVLRRWIWSQSVEVRHISTKRMNITRLAADVPHLAVETHLGSDIFNLKFLGDDWYVVARTNCSLIFCDLAQGLSSEVPWNWSGKEKFFAQAMGACLVYRAGEISVIQYGLNEILYTARSERVNPHVLSVRIGEGNDKSIKRFAYLMDKQTLCVVDLVTGKPLVMSWHDFKIDWLELSESGDVLLYRDARKRLTLLYTDTGIKEIIASGVGFVQWVEDSDAVVAQTPTHILVWYCVTETSAVELLDAGGDLAIEVKDSKIMLQRGQPPYIELDKHRLRFNSSLRANDLSGCAEYLKLIPESSDEVLQLWRQLANRAMQLQDLSLAALCFKEIGDEARSHFLRTTLDLAKSEGDNDLTIGVRSPLVRARLSIFNGDLKAAEEIYVKYSSPMQAVEMYKSLFKWSEAIAVADKFDLSLANSLKDQQLEFLKSTGRVGNAGAVLAARGRVVQAARLWLEGGRPRRAAGLVLNHPQLLADEQLVKELMKALVQGEWWETAGELSEKLDDIPLAIDYYAKGNNYARAIQLARESNPSSVRELEARWGEWLLESRRAAAAVAHLIEAGLVSRALYAALAARQYTNAKHILQSIDDKESVKEECEQLGNYFITIQDWESAETVLVEGNLVEKCVDAYNKAEKYIEGLRLAKKHFSDDFVKEMYKEIALKLENSGDLRRAESIYIGIGEADEAIAMYKRAHDYQGMVRTVEASRPELLQPTLIHVARSLQEEQDYNAAERYFLRAGDWKSVVQMYRSVENWEAADRVAKIHAPESVQQQLLFLWASNLSSSAGARLLISRGAGENGARWAAAAGRWELANELAQRTQTLSQRDLLILRARQQEPEEAESMFLEAKAADMAVDMWIEKEEFARALEIAEKYVSEKVDEVLEAYSEWAERNGDLALYETLMLRANRAEDLIQYYLDNGMEAEAERIRGGTGNDIGGVAEALQAAAKYAKANSHQAAVRELCRASQRAADAGEYEVAERAALRAARVARDRLEPSQRTAAAQLIAERMAAIGQEDVGEQIRSALLEGYHSDEDNEAGPSEQTAASSEVQDEALERLARAGQWDRCLSLAGTRAPQYARLQARSILQADNESSLESALSVLRRWGASDVDSELAAVLLAKATSRLPYAYTLLRDTRDVLYSAASSSNDGALWNLVMAASLCACACGPRRPGAKAARAALRFTDVITADAAFYTAGMIAREEESTGEALVLLNRCLDLAEAADDHVDPSTLDFDDFEYTDFPRKVLLGDSASVSGEMLDEVREWVLAYSMEANIRQELPVDSRGLYPSSLGSQTGCCVLTGYPLSSRVVRFANGKSANRESWSRLVAASNDDEHADIASDIIAFVTLWCGPNDYSVI